MTSDSHDVTLSSAASSSTVSAASAQERPLQVTHIITSLWTGGAEMMLYKLLKGFGERRYSHTVICLRPMGEIGDRIATLGVPVYALGGRPTRPGWVIRLLRVLRTINPDLIQSWMYHANLAAVLGKALSSQSTPLIWGVRASPSNVYSSWTRRVIQLGARFSERPERIIYNSVSSARLHEEIGYNARRTVVIPNGFDTTLFAPNERVRITIRGQLQIPLEAFVIGFVARYSPAKDFATFFSAIAHVLSQQPDVHVIIAGKDATPKNPEIVQLLAAHNLTDRINNIHFLGAQEEVAPLWAACDIACSSSISEAFSNAIGEAMASGLPCVVTNVGDSSYIVGDTGIVVPPRDADALGQGLLQMVHMPQEVRFVMGASARQRIEDNFSIEAAVQAFESVYHDVVRT